MANDPNRDYLPVKDVDDRSSKAGVNCRLDLNIIGKLKRCDLEDRYMRLYDENTQVKKQLNSQEEKIKRLGTKLLRLIGEKKNCPDSCRRRQDGKGVDELQMRIIELEHENYTLKDRNVVLKQQLANHARQHVAAHRSPNRSIHNSPRMSQRQSSAPNVNDHYMPSSRNQAHDIQMREAEEHINELNDEIKSLHNKIDALQQDLEKSSLENQKTKVCENIELIRLQRSLKQQSVQIAALQAQIKNSEKNQKLLRDELASAHKENEESLQIISDKQKEILDLYTKLEERNVGRLECEEMKERIKDLTSERDTLRERGEFLMKTIESKSSEADMIKELKRLLESEKSKKKELKESLENTQKLLQSLKDIRKVSQSSEEAISKETVTVQNADKTFATIEKKSRSDSKIGVENELDLLASTHLVYHSERNSGSRQADSKFQVEDRKGRKFSMGNVGNKETTSGNSPRREVKVGHDTGTKISGSETSGSSQGKPQTFESIQTPGGNNCNSEGDKPLLGPPLQQWSKDDASMSASSQPFQFKQVPSVSQTKQYSEVPPVSQLSNYSQIPPVSQLPNYSQVPPVSQLPNYSQVPPVYQLPNYSQVPPVSQLPNYSQVPPVYQLPNYSQVRPVYQLPNYSQVRPVSQLSNYSQVRPVYQLPNYSQVPPVYQLPNYSQVPPVSPSSNYSQTGQAPPVSQKTVKPKASQVPQASSGSQEKVEPKASQVPQASSGSQEKVEPKKNRKSKAVNKLQFKQDSDVEQVTPVSQEKVEPKASQVPQASSGSQEKVEPKKNRKSKAVNKLQFKQDSDGEQVTPVSQEKVEPKASQVPQASSGSQEKVEPKASQVPQASSGSQEKIEPKASQVPQASSGSLILNIHNFDEVISPQTFLKLSIDWLKLQQNTSVWNDESIKLLYVDFAFFDVRGKETETPVSLKKPKNPREKCHFNFTTSIRVTRQRANCLRMIRNRWDEGLIVFKVVSEPEESNEECVDIGVAKLTVKEFFKSSPNKRIFLPVYNTTDLDELIGYLTVRLDISSD